LIFNPFSATRPGAASLAPFGAIHLLCGENGTKPEGIWFLSALADHAQAKPEKNSKEW
jgi:hypothetical protein